MTTFVSVNLIGASDEVEWLELVIGRDFDLNERETQRLKDAMEGVIAEAKRQARIEALTEVADLAKTAPAMRFGDVEDALRKWAAMSPDEVDAANALEESGQSSWDMKQTLRDWALRQMAEDS